MRPASYRGTASFAGSVASLSRALNPLHWHEDAPYLWFETYLMAPAGSRGAAETGAPPHGTSPDTGLPWFRAEAPAQAPARDCWTPTQLFEAVVFDHYLYRNVLLTDRVNQPDKISLHYSQVECLETVARRPCDGGIDLDVGEGTATREPDGTVRLVVTKTIRFTQPQAATAEVNLLAHVMVPLCFDFWLHAGLFGTGGSTHG